MPVSTAMKAGIEVLGRTRVWNSPSTSPPRTLTAPISVISQLCAEPPVVSRSTTTKVVSRSGVPSSSKVACTGTCSARAAGGRPWDGGLVSIAAGRAGGMGRTVGAAADRSGSPRSAPDERGQAGVTAPARLSHDGAGGRRRHPADG
jgi:hypothetical protein